MRRSDYRFSLSTSVSGLSWTFAFNNVFAPPMILCVIVNVKSMIGFWSSMSFNQSILGGTVYLVITVELPSLVIEAILITVGEMRFVVGVVTVARSSTCILFCVRRWVWRIYVDCKVILTMDRWP